MNMNRPTIRLTKIFIFIIVVSISISCVSLNTTIVYDGNGKKAHQHRVEYNDKTLVATNELSEELDACFDSIKQILKDEPALPSIPNHYRADNEYIANQLLDHYEDMQYHIRLVIKELDRCQTIQKN